MAILVLLHEGLTIKKIPIEKAELLIGRKTDCDIFLDDNMVSSLHAKIEMIAPAGKKSVFDYYVEDLQSTNKTIVNGVAVQRKKLAHNDKIRIGRHLFKRAQRSPTRPPNCKKAGFPGFITPRSRGKKGTDFFPTIQSFTPFL